ncbi:hypothetical protein QBC40DRAFT_214868 [Triangularia verruculosa]|uniref:Uncharacterized protein n=1 Tax=Triangularia verruculosa TaxID=2587418 RepID=A0AAN6XTU4_9PEZI|nr:hypothetical protein QBC40DRAFT_214868 [Triangularia verruculosa]
MKQALTLLSAFTWLQVASAACCRTNKCFKAIADPLVNGLEDCSSAFEAVIVAPEVSTVTETVTEIPTEYASLVETEAVSTATATEVVSTETLFDTISTTVTATTTQTSVTRVTRAYATVTLTVTSTTTVPAGAASRIAKRAADTEPAPTSGTPASAIPSYASAHCPSWEKYTSICKCAGATQQTITGSASAVTETVTFTDSATTVSVPVTIPITTTIIDLITATETDTTTDTASITATVTTTVTGNVLVLGSTTTVTSTVVSTVTAPTQICSNVATFQATANQHANTELYLYAALNNGMSGLYGSTRWNPTAPTSQPHVYDVYNWILDDQGYLAFMYNGNFKVSAYVTVGTAATLQMQMSSSAQYSPSYYERVKGCVNTVTGELTLDAGGRKSVLLCGQQQLIYLSSGDGSEAGLQCTRMYPKLVSA